MPCLEVVQRMQSANIQHGKVQYVCHPTQQVPTRSSQVQVGGWLVDDG